jgi:hypothetical protein
VPALLRAIRPCEVLANPIVTTTQPGVLDPLEADSLGLRQKVLTAYHHQEGSIRQLAKRFTVSPRL